MGAQLRTTTKLLLLHGVEEGRGEEVVHKTSQMALLRNPSPQPSPRASLRGEGVNAGGGVKLRPGSESVLVSYLAGGGTKGRSSQASPTSRFMWLLTPAGIFSEPLPS